MLEVHLPQTYREHGGWVWVLRLNKNGEGYGTGERVDEYAKVYPEYQSVGVYLHYDIVSVGSKSELLHMNVPLVHLPKMLLKCFRLLFMPVCYYNIDY